MRYYWNQAPFLRFSKPLDGMTHYIPKALINELINRSFQPSETKNTKISVKPELLKCHETDSVSLIILNNSIATETAPNES